MTLFKDYKEFFEREFELEYHDIYVVREQVSALITAYETAQAELAKASVKVRYLEEAIWTHGNAPIGNESEHENERDVLIATLRKQLAGAQAELAKIKDTVKYKRWEEALYDRDIYLEKCSALRKQLAEAGGRKGK